MMVSMISSILRTAPPEMRRRSTRIIRQKRCGSRMFREPHLTSSACHVVKLSCGRDSGTDRAAHAGAAEPAIAARVLRQILLMIVLGEIQRRRIEDLGGDGITPASSE